MYTIFGRKLCYPEICHTNDINLPVLQEKGSTCTSPTKPNKDNLLISQKIQVQQVNET